MGSGLTFPRQSLNPLGRDVKHLRVCVFTICHEEVILGGVGGVLRRVCRQGLSWTSPAPRDLHWLLLAWTAESFSDSMPHSIPQLRVKCSTGTRRKPSWPAAETLPWKMTWFRVSDQMEQQIGSIWTPPNPLPATAPTCSKISDPSPTPCIALGAFGGLSWGPRGKRCL